MIRITHARMTFQGFPGGRDRASEIAHHALRQAAERTAPADRVTAPRARVQLTVRVPHGASDAAIATRVAEAIDRQLGHRADRTGR